MRFTQTDFWAIIEESRQKDELKQLENLERLLRSLPAQDLPYYLYHDTTFREEAFRWPLWDFAYVVFGGCGDERFTELRAWLVYRGEKTFRAALGDPESLIDELRGCENLFQADFCSRPTAIVEERIGNSRYPDGLSVPNSPEPAGEHDPNFEVAFPKAWAEFEEKKAWLL